MERKWDDGWIAAMLIASSYNASRLSGCLVWVIICIARTCEKSNWCRSNHLYVSRLFSSIYMGYKLHLQASGTVGPQDTHPPLHTEIHGY